jgi:hypothetical protein
VQSESGRRQKENAQLTMVIGGRFPFEHAPPRPLEQSRLFSPLEFLRQIANRFKFTNYPNRSFSMGPIEQAARKEIPEGSAIAEIAYKLAFSLDEGDGSVAMAKELRSILAEERQRKPSDNKAYRMQKLQEAKWAMMQEGEWEWSDEAGDYVRVDDEGIE